jgi:hypothetical protein
MMRLVIASIPIVLGAQTVSNSPLPNSGAAVFGQPTQSARAVPVANATDVVKLWQAQQHLYVKGNLGVSQDQLDSLQTWLDENALNWTVVLVESATGERYTDTAGQTYFGLDAVGHALGKGLPNQTAFGQQVEPRTREANGAFFLLFLKERKFSYFASDAQDNRGLGEANWVGNLDQPALAAMRSGGRIVDAVKNTILNINRQLDQKIAAEVAAREARAAADKAAQEQRIAAEKAARALAEERAKASLKTASEAYVLLEQQIGELNRAHPNLSGDLGRPDLAALRAELAGAQSALQSGQVVMVTATATRVRERIEALLRAIEDYGRTGEQLETLARSIERQSARPHAISARPMLHTAREALAQARREYARGDSSYRAARESARVALASAENVINATALAAAYHQRLMALSGLVGLLVLGATGWGLNRRRRGAKKDAIALLRAWENGLGEKNVALFNLLDRASALIGSSSEETAKRYSGETRKLGEQIIKDVDELFIMSACAGRVLQDAQRLVEPAQVWPRIHNLFAPGKYRAAIRLLRDQPVTFKPEEALELVVRGPKTERDTLLGNLASYQPFAMTFQELIEAFNQRASRALAALETVESSLVKVGAALEEVQNNIDMARSRETEIARQAESDGLLRIPTVFSQLIPAAQTSLSEAVKIAIRDAVGALQGHGAAAKQKADAATALVTLATELRKNSLPQILEAERSLNAAGLSTQWLQAEVVQGSDRAEQLAQQSLQTPTQIAITALKEDLANLAERISRAVTLDQVRRETSPQAIDEAASSIATARREISAALGTKPDDVLGEPGANPSDRVRQAQEQLAAAKAALERGDIAAAQNALDSTTQLANEAQAIVQATRQAFADHESTSAAWRAETEQITARLPEHERILACIKEQYAPEVLLLGAGDPTHPNANGTVADNLAEAQDHLDAARDLQAQSAKAFRAAQVLAAADLLAQVKARQETAQFRLQEITEKEKRLAETERSNAQLLAQLQTRIQEYEPMVHDAKTMMPTVNAFAQARQLVVAARARTECSQRDPFQAAQELANASQALDGVAEHARCDRGIFAEAERSLSLAAAQLETATRLARQAATDAIQDSPAITRARHEVEALNMAFENAQVHLRSAHGDWAALDAEADRIAAEAGRHAATLQGELREAEAAVAAISTAALAVRTADSWTGSYGVVIFGCPGSDGVAQARALLQQGHYRQAQAIADSAHRMANQAVAEAEAEARRRRRAEEERRERERRRREEEETARWQRHSVMSHGLGSHASGPRHSGFSIGSGASHSSFSSGSGVSRSGW